jgi:hypothetical protein
VFLCPWQWLEVKNGMGALVPYEEDQQKVVQHAAEAHEDRGLKYQRLKVASRPDPPVNKQTKKNQHFRSSNGQKMQSFWVEKIYF